MKDHWVALNLLLGFIVISFFIFVFIFAGMEHKNNKIFRNM